MRIAITGASGNLGSALVERLLAEGDHEVVGMARRPPEDERVEWHRVDLTWDGDRPLLDRAIRGADAVVHLAWGFQPTHRIDHLAELGVGGTRRVAQAVARTGVPHLVHISSVGAYSPRQGLEPVTEDYPTDGIPSSPYSRHKAAAERVLDGFEGEFTIARVRPGIVGQRTAGSALLRYGVPLLVPARLVRHVPVVPLDDEIAVSMVHAEDVAEALLRILERRAPGPFNLAAGAIGADGIADVLGARRVPVPASVLRAAAAASWHLRLQQVDAGWLDMAHHSPLLDATRARRDLDWSPRHDAREVFEEVVEGLAHADSGDTAVLRQRSIPRELVNLLRGGPVSRRTRP